MEVKVSSWIFVVVFAYVGAQGNVPMHKIIKREASCPVTQ